MEQSRWEKVQKKYLYIWMERILAMFYSINRQIVFDPALYNHFLSLKIYTKRKSNNTFLRTKCKRF